MSSVVVLSITEPIHLQNVVRCAHQCPLAPHFVDPAQEKLSEAPRLFDLAEDRLDNGLTCSIDSGSRFFLELTRHPIYTGRSLCQRTRGRLVRVRPQKTGTDKL